MGEATKIDMVSVFSGSSPRVGIPTLRLSPYFGGVYAVIADTNKLGVIL